MPADNVVPLNPMQPGRMAEAEYDSERARLDRTYGGSANAAGVRWEHELAQLFYRSRWTQAELAKKEGKSQSWIARHLLLGRFLAETLAISKNMPSWHKLTESTFRELWKTTDPTLSETARFREVVERLTTAAKNAEKRHNPVADAIRDQFSDGKWHTPAVIAKAIKTPVPEVKRTLDLMNGRPSKKYDMEKRQVAKDYQYRIFPREKTISSLELIEKLTPLIRALEAQQHTNMATVSIATFGSVASQLKALLKEWCQ